MVERRRFMRFDTSMSGAYELSKGKSEGGTEIKNLSREGVGILADKEILKIGKFKIGLTHGQGHPSGLPELILNMFKNDAVDAIIFGHSHNPTNEVKNGVLLFNPGSATDKIFAEYNSYGILEITDNKTEGTIIKL